MNKIFTQAVKERRSFYHISKSINVSDAKLQEIVEFSVKWTPTAFNSQSSRAVLLLKDHHDKLWDSTREILRKLVPADKFKPTNDKMDGFKSGYGTVLYFDDQASIRGMQEKFPLYAERFPEWGHHSNGILQFVVWLYLEEHGLGASLQHYNPLIDHVIQQEWSIPADWKLIAQMPFGHPTQQPGEKTFVPVEERTKIFK